MGSLGNKTVSLSGFASGEEQTGELMSYENSFIKIDEKSDGGNKMNDDLISRQEVIFNLANIARNCAKSDKQKSLIGRCIYMTEHIPAAQPKQKTGRWGLAIGYDPKRKFVCDQCVRMAYEQSKYCPNCGARMENG